MKVTVQAFQWAKKHKRDFEAVISLEDPDARNKLRFHTHPAPAHLVLRFVDLDRPAPVPYNESLLFKMAEERHLQQALDFGKRYSNVLVHCQAGVGRSPAVGLALLAQYMGHGFEQEAFNELMHGRPEAVPNLHVVALADKLLNRQGKLLNVVAEWDRNNPKNLDFRARSRKAHFTYYGFTDAIEKDKNIL